MEPFLAQVLLFAGNFAPRGWALCEGQLLPINQNQALFSLLGTTYGGDGRTTFGLPDLRSRAPLSPGRGAGLPNYDQGERGGNATTVLLTANLPQSQINIPSSSATGTTPEAGNNVMATPDDDKLIYATTATGGMKAGSIIGAANLPFSNEPPFLALNYIIALQGTFPSRS